jgi:hypothetical protein
VNAKTAQPTIIASQGPADGPGHMLERFGLGIPARSTPPAQSISNLTFRFLVAIDVAGFSRYSAAEQAKIQDDLESAMTQAAGSAGLDREHWYCQPRGDGELAVLPAGGNGLSLVADYPRELASRIAEINLSSRSSRLRVRLAIHHGAVLPGRFGPVGPALITVARLVDAPVVRQQLHKRSDLHVGLIVSGTIYDEVIRSELCDLSPSAFRRVNTRAKGIAYIGYLYQRSLESSSPAAGSRSVRTTPGCADGLIRAHA